MSSPYWPGETPPAPTRPDPPTRTNGLAIASLVLGLVGIFTFVVLAIPPTLAVIFGGVALGQIEDPRRHQSGRGMAIAGIALGAVGIVAFLVLVGLSASGVIHDDTSQPVRACAGQRAVVDSFDRLANQVCVPDGPTFAPVPHGYQPDVSLRRALANAGQSGTDPTVHPFLALVTWSGLSSRTAIVWVIADDSYAVCTTPPGHGCVVTEHDQMIDTTTGVQVGSYSWDSRARPAFFGAPPS